MLHTNAKKKMEKVEFVVIVVVVVIVIVMLLYSCAQSWKETDRDKDTKNHESC